MSRIETWAAVAAILGVVGGGFAITNSNFNSGLDRLHGDIGKLEESLRGDIGKLDSRLDGLDRRLASVEGTLGAMGVFIADAEAGGKDGEL